MSEEKKNVNDIVVEEQWPVTEDFLVRVTHPETGEMIPGQFVWTPLDEAYANDFQNRLIYTPDATESIPRFRDEPSKLERKIVAFAKPLDLSTSEIDAREDEVSQLLDKPDSLKKALERLTLARSIVGATREYREPCPANRDLGDNCAHLLSNAFIMAGYSELKTWSGISSGGRCPCGRERPIRAYDMLKWFQSKKREFRSGVIPRGNGVWATYQEKPGAKHVLISDTDDWVAYGTDDFPDWPVQYNYRW